MRNIVSAAILNVLLCAGLRAQAPAPASENWDARLTEVKGEVVVVTASEPGGVPGDKAMPLEEGDRITTGPDGSADVALDAGSLIHLAADSDFTLTDLKRSQSSFGLNAGTFLAKIQKLLSAQSMVVKTPTAVAAVRGTEFGVEIDPKSPDETHVGVFDEGKVEVRGQSGAPETIIGGQETKVVKGQAPLHAYQLQRLMRHRAFMRAAMKQRIGRLKKSWKGLPPRERRELRQKIMLRMRERRAKLKEAGKQAAEQKEKNIRRRKNQDAEVERKRKKMEEFRNRIRRGKGGGQ